MSTTHDEGVTKHKGKRTVLHGRGGSARSARKQAFEVELAELVRWREALDPRSLTPPAKFSELPLSNSTRLGLQQSYFHTLTPIQAKSLPYSLKSSDILGAARTGSGKTLAFIVPLLEKLYTQRWGPADGLGALVISPTRELAVQIFEVLRKVGSYHSFSAGLVIGGKSLKEEQERLSRMNILIATPGRLLQHMDQTTSFDTSNLQLLVLDEADRILDLGFSKTMNAIIQNLPPSSLRQTLLFSATQTNNVQSLARLSLKEPIYIHVKDSENASTSVRNLQDTSQADNDDKSMETPTGLEQHYMLVDLDKKLDTLWSFVKSHLACKTIVFMSSCKQVRFAYETFRHLRPGISLLHMHGKQKQSQRLAIYSRFTSSDKCVLFATDVAARGLDFPSVTWVVQLDCPEDVETYIHRVGRTARYQSKGKALLMLHQSEQPGFLKKLKEKNLFDRVGLIKANQNKQQSIQKQFQSLAFQYPEIKFLAQRAFISYVRSIHLQKHKTIFKVSELPLDKFAQSLGLAGTPQIKFLTKKEASEKKNKAREVENLKLARPVDSDDPVGQAGSGGEESVSSSSEDIGEEDETFIKNGVPPPVVSKAGISSKTTQYDKMYKRKNQGILSDHYTTVLARDDPEGDKRSLSLVGRDDLQEEFITLARPKDNMAGENMDTLDNADGMSLSGHEDLSKRQLKLGLTKKGLHKLRGQGDKLIFDEAGQGHALYELIGEDDIKDVGKERREFVEQQARNMKDVDVLDKEAIKNLKREKKRKRKEREREVDGKIVGGMDELVPSNPDQDEEEDAVKDIDFGDLPTDVENEFGRPAKKGKTKQKYVGDVEVEGDLEAMALSALRKVRK